MTYFTNVFHLKSHPRTVLRLRTGGWNFAPNPTPGHVSITTIEPGRNSSNKKMPCMTEKSHENPERFRINTRIGLLQVV